MRKHAGQMLGQPSEVPKPDGYKYHSQTSSGWEIQNNPDAPKEKRWRIVHPEYGERFFPHREYKGRNIIMEFTVKHMMQQAGFLKDDKA
jgi:hypothetical protein